MAVVSRFVPVDLRGRRAVVVGAGIAGLASTLALGERGADVLVVDADPAPDVSTTEQAFFAWSRSRVPQSRHSHVFLARLRKILLRAHPEIYSALLDAGARELRLLDFPPATMAPIVPEPGDEELATIGCRRTTFEWVLRRAVESRAFARFLSASTTVALTAEAGRVTGVEIENRRGRRSTIGADFVIDATGRTSRAPEWLERIGVAAPAEERSSSAILYYTRYYRVRPGRELPRPTDQPTMADFGWVKFAIFPADNGTYSITFAAHLSIPRLKVLQHAAAFEELARTLPGLAPFVDPALAEPLAVNGRSVLAMGGLENCRRRFLDAADRPLAPGFFAIGDSAYHTNPLYGRGATQAFMHAALLGEALDATVADVDGAAALLDELSQEEIEPFYRASIAADEAAARKVGVVQGSVVERWLDRFFEDGVMTAVRTEPVAYRAFTRMMNMIETPKQAFFAPAVLPRVVAIWLRGRRYRERFEPWQPDRDATIAAAERAAKAMLRAPAGFRRTAGVQTSR